MAPLHLSSVSYPRPGLIREASQRPVILVGPAPKGVSILFPNRSLSLVLLKEVFPTLASLIAPPALVRLDPFPIFFGKGGYHGMSAQ